MDTITGWIGNLVSDVGHRIEYSVLHMNLTQWGIFAFTCLTLGVLAMRSRMPH